VFFFIGAASLFSGIFLTHTVLPNLGVLHLLRRIEYMMLLLVGYYAIKEKRQINVILATLVLVTLIVNFYGFGQVYLGFPVISTTNLEYSKSIILYLAKGDRVISTFAGHYDLAAFLVMVLSVTTAFIPFFISQRKKLIRRKNIFFLILLIIFYVSSLLILIKTAARLSFAASVIGIVVSLILIGKKKYLFGVAAILLIASAYPSQLRDRLISTFTVNIKSSWNKYFEGSKLQQEINQLNIPTLPNSKFYERDLNSLYEVEGPKDIAPGEPTDITELGVFRSFEIRLKVEWPRAIRAFIKNPIFGTGYSSIGLATDNDFLRSLGEVGIFGTFSFLLIIIEIAKDLWRKYRIHKGFYKYLYAGSFSMLISLLVNSLFIDIFEASKIASIFWLFLGVILAAKEESYDA
jgi:hypothetical protein